VHGGDFLVEAVPRELGWMRNPLAQTAAVLIPEHEQVLVGERRQGIAQQPVVGARSAR
jgi:hypothetical protein